MMQPDPPLAPPADGGTVTDLLARRAQIQAWLERLDDLGAEVPDRVAARVRADYEQRLRSVVDALSGHVDALRGDRERLAERLAAAAQRHDRVVDALEEARLRNRIGELEDSEWELRRPELEAEVDEALTALEEARTETGRLEELLGQIDAEVAAAERRPEPPVAKAPAAMEVAPEAETLPEPEVTVPERPAAAAPAAAEDSQDDDLAFLHDLDRAIGAAPAQPELAETRPQPGVKCPDCGYTNDPTAWYCGVCGVDLA